MKWSFSLGRIAGIDVRVHTTFFLLLAWVGWSSYSAGGSSEAALRGVILILLLFGIVVLHELGHALTARRFGISTRDITLLPIGGVARLEKMPDNPREELLVAVAGPAVNVVLAVGFGLLATLLRQPLLPSVEMPDQLPLVVQLFWLNVSVAVFNMLPAFPMDGGRALRAALALRMDSLRATEVAVRLGKATAFGFALLGLFANPVLILIAAFVWIGANAELHEARMEGALHDLPVGAATIREFYTLRPQDPLSVAVAHVLQGFQHDFPVLDRGRVVGLLSHRSLLEALQAGGAEFSVAQAMDDPPPVVDFDSPLVEAIRKVQSSPSLCVLVESGGRLVGLLTLHGVGELFAIRQALRGGASSAAKA